MGLLAWWQARRFYKDLIVRVSGDWEVAERLISFELEKGAGDRLTATKRAIQRLARHRGL